MLPVGGIFFGIFADARSYNLLNGLTFFWSFKEDFMDRYAIYNDIARRTEGDIYVGVVGPVRTGKSTFITKFMESFVIPNIKDKYKKDRVVDELPQAGDGKTITTTQPKFVPGESVRVTLREDINVNVRLIDCVGYVVEGAMGIREGEKQRLIMTPWSDADMPFEKAAEMGTQKVIKDHSTIGVLVTTDGSITDIPRGSYIPAEERVVRELKELNKPFVIVLNSKNPSNGNTQKLRDSLEEKYQVPVVCIDVTKMSADEIAGIFERVLMEFPLRRMDIELSDWMGALPKDNDTIREIMEQAAEAIAEMRKMRDFEQAKKLFTGSPKFNPPEDFDVSLGEGAIRFKVSAKPELFYKVLSQIAGEAIDSDFRIMSFVANLASSKKHYDRIKEALADVEAKGYGVVTPGIEQLTLEEPEIVKSGGRFGLRLKASAPSLHIIRVDINTEVSPIVGTEQQSEELVKYLLSEFESDPKGIWETNMFGKPLHNLVREGLTNKLLSMPTDAQNKMRKTISRIVNEGRGGVICILL
jgi:stage IV sporulation protein A